MANASRSAQMAQLAQARQGDEAALAGIIARMMPVVNAAAARAVCPGLEFEDAVQEGLVGLFCAVRTYKGGAGTAFSTYAAACVRNAVNSAARAASRRKHDRRTVYFLHHLSSARLFLHLFELRFSFNHCSSFTIALLLLLLFLPTVPPVSDSVRR